MHVSTQQDFASVYSTIKTTDVMFVAREAFPWAECCLRWYRSCRGIPRYAGWPAAARSAARVVVRIYHGRPHTPTHNTPLTHCSLVPARAPPAPGCQGPTHLQYNIIWCETEYSASWMSMNMQICIAPVRQESSQTLATKKMTFEFSYEHLGGHWWNMQFNSMVADKYQPLCKGQDEHTRLTSQPHHTISKCSVRCGCNVNVVCPAFGQRLALVGNHTPERLFHVTGPDTV